MRIKFFKNFNIQKIPNSNIAIPNNNIAIPNNNITTPNNNITPNFNVVTLNNSQNKSKRYYSICY